MGGLFANDQGCGDVHKWELILKIGCFTMDIHLCIPYVVYLSRIIVIQHEDKFSIFSEES